MGLEETLYLNKVAVQPDLPIGGTDFDRDGAASLEPPLHDHETVHGLLDEDVLEDPAVDPDLCPPILGLVQIPDALLDSFLRLVLGTRFPKQGIDDVGGVEVVEHVGGGPRSGLVQKVDKRHVVGGEADASGVDLSVLNIEIIFGLNLDPWLIDEDSSLGMDDGSVLSGVG